MLINLSNDISSNWMSEQLRAATEEFGKIIDIPFPKISPDWTIEEVEVESVKYYEILSEIVSLSEDKKNAVLVLGEQTFTYKLIELLKKKKIYVVTPTYMVTTTGVEKRTTKKTFVMFRNYF